MVKRTAYSFPRSRGIAVRDAPRRLRRHRAAARSRSPRWRPGRRRGASRTAFPRGTVGTSGTNACDRPTLRSLRPALAHDDLESRLLAVADHAEFDRVAGLRAGEAFHVVLHGRDGLAGELDDQVARLQAPLL